mgnify:CR=1 FL=1
MDLCNAMYEINQYLTGLKIKVGPKGIVQQLLEENETLTQIVYDARRPPDSQPTISDGISPNCLGKIRLINVDFL